jgi:hypothetical protein
VVHLVEAMRYKPEGHEFVSRWNHWYFLLTQTSGRTMVLWSTHSLTEINKRDMSRGKSGLNIELIILPISCANCLEMVEAAPSSNP